MSSFRVELGCVGGASPIVRSTDLGLLEVGWLVGCRFESNCPLVEPGSIGGMPFVEVFLRDPSPHLSEFRRKPRKTPNG